jgi:hypothetical protein
MHFIAQFKVRVRATEHFNKLIQACVSKRGGKFDFPRALMTHVNLPAEHKLTGIQLYINPDSSLNVDLTLVSYNIFIRNGQF